MKITSELKIISSDENTYIAAIDLGSNSFHMVITKEGEEGGMTVIDRVQEMVRLGAGLDTRGYLSEETQSRALQCLDRFNQRLKAIPNNRIRAVGTNTFRVAKNRDEFLKQAESALGHPISIISGHEEARLVYLGAAFGLSVTEKQRLVIDIGGGSTELTIGRGFKPFYMDSLYMGCVSMTRRIFDDGIITKSKVRQAETLVKRELETLLKKYQSVGWDEVVGTSGTIKSIDKVSRELGLNQDWISVEGLDLILKWVLKEGKSEHLLHVSEQRRPVFIGGFVILSTIFRDLGIDRMDISQGALREGVAYDLVGRLHNQDSRFAGVNKLVAQFQPDLEQIKRVKNLSGLFLSRVRDSWKLNQGIDEKLLQWAAQLHELGMTISYTHHHLHGAYIIENGDIDGFSRQVQKVLALMVRNSRQKLDSFHKEWMSDAFSLKVMRLTVLLRLAIAFFRGRLEAELSDLQLAAKGNSIKITIRSSWAKAHPLTIFDLQTEKSYLSAINFNLEIDFR